MRKGTLLERVDKITTKEKKVDIEGNIIHNYLTVMDYFKISWQDVNDMPLAAFNEALRYIKKMKDKDEKDAKNMNRKKPKRF